MPGGTLAAQPVRSVALSAEPGSEAARRSSGVCSPSYPTRNVRQIWQRPDFAGLSLDPGASRSSRQNRNGEFGASGLPCRVVCGGRDPPRLRHRGVAPGHERKTMRPTPGMVPGGNFYRRPSLERGLLPDEDLTRMEALYIADAETEPARKAAIPWRPVLANVLTACLASFMFGFHIGVVNGPLEYIARDLGFAGSNVLKGAVVSATLAGAFLGSIGGGSMADAVGRRRTFQLNAVPLLVGAATSAAARSVGAMIAGRFLVGLGLGIATAVLPLYISEISPSAYRGTMGSLNQLTGCAGILAALLLSLPLRSNPSWWRTMFWCATVPAAALAAGMARAAESPRWLYQRGRVAEAERTLGVLWGPAALGDAMAGLKATAQEGPTGKEATWRDLASPRYVKVVAIGCTLFALQQLSGINAIFYFSSTVFRNAGVQSQFLANVGLGVVNLAGAVLALFLMDRWGRRKALRVSYTGMAACLLLSAAAMTLPVLRPWSGPLSVAATLGYVLAFCLGAGPVPALLLPEMFPQRIRSRALAACMACHWVFNFGIGLYFLEVVRLVGLPGVYAGFAGVALLTVAFSQRCIIETQGKSLEEIERMLGTGGGH